MGQRPIWVDHNEVHAQLDLGRRIGSDEQARQVVGAPALRRALIERPIER